MADALSGPTLSQKFPSFSCDSYFTSLADLDFIGKMCKIEEYLVLKRRLPKRFRFFESLFCSLLSLICNMLNPKLID
jgi:hypothetical protein